MQIYNQKVQGKETAPGLGPGVRVSECFPGAFALPSSEFSSLRRSLFKSREILPLPLNVCDVVLRRHLG